MLYKSVNNGDLIVVQNDHTEPIIYFKIVGGDDRLRTTTKPEFQRNFNRVWKDEDER